MKRSKLSITAIAAITAVSLTTAGIFAWFVSDTVTGNVDVTAGAVGYTMTDLTIPQDELLLPGEAYEFNDIKIVGTGTLPTTVKVNFASSDLDGKVKIEVPGLTQDLYNGLTPDMQADYVLENGVYYVTGDRVGELVSISMNNEVGAFVADPTQDDVYYTVVEAAEERLFDELKFTISPELGGNVKDSSGNRTPSRTFEQGAKFKFGVMHEGIQTSKGALVSEYGQETADAIYAQFSTYFK